MGTSEDKAKSVSEIAQNAIERPIFIIGTMRSGTSILGQCLNESPQIIGCPFELRRVWHHKGNVAIASDVCGSECPEIASSKTVNIKKLKLAFAQEFIKNIGNKKRKSNLRFLNKNPHLSNKIEMVSTIFPNAQFIWTYRNLFDVVCSLKNLFNREGLRRKRIIHVWPKTDEEHRCFSVSKRSFFFHAHNNREFPGGDVKFLAEYWLESNLSLLKYYQKHSESKIIIVPHNEILSSPSEVRRQLITFLDLPHDDLLSIEKNINHEATKNWKDSLSEMENHQLNAFSQKEVLKINELVRTVNFKSNNK